MFTATLDRNASSDRDYRQIFYLGGEMNSAVVEPAHFVEEIKKLGSLPDVVWPDSVVVSYMPGDWRFKNSGYAVEARHRFLTSELVQIQQQKAWLLTKVGMGAAQITFLVELLIVLGVKKFITIGSAGSISESIRAGEIVLCTKAWSEEGVSIHYNRQTEWTYPSVDLNGQIKAQLQRKNLNYHEAATWTTDALFRETREKVDHFQNIGVSTVEMEASALFAVADYRDVEAASLFFVSDELHGSTWQPNMRGFGGMWNQLLAVALESLNR